MSLLIGQLDYENDMATIKPRSDLDYSQGFTICLRVLFKYLNRNCVIESDNFHLAIRQRTLCRLGNPNSNRCYTKNILSIYFFECLSCYPFNNSCIL